MKRTITRLLSLFLCLLTVAGIFSGLIPVAAAASDTPKAPVIKSATGRYDSVPTITWNETEGGYLYGFYRATKKDGPYQRMFVTDIRTQTDDWAQPGTTYYYAVKSISRSGKESEFSNILCFNWKFPAPTVSVKSDAASGNPKLSWKAVKDALGYFIYRAPSKTGKYQVIMYSTGTSYVDTTAEPGKTYYYKVSGHRYEAESAHSNVVSRTCDLPRPVVKATNAASTGKVKLSWEKIEGAAKYEIYRATSKSGEYKLLKTTTSTSYTTGGTAGKTYYYKVKAIHSKSAANSAYSEIVSRMRDLARPEVSIKLKSGDPRLSWKEISGAAKYTIYRATSKDGTYKEVKTTTNLSWTDTTAKSGKTYFYRVKAVHKNTSANSARSTAVQIKAK